MAGEGTGGGGEGSGSYSVQLSTGRSMPLLGIGTARLKAEGAVTAVLEALRAGYRHIDGAKVYGNEAFVGAAIAKAVSEGVVRRSELFVTSKCWNDDHRPEHVRRACLRSLQDLQLEYLDLYLVHWPLAWRKGTLGCTDGGACLLGTWRAMEALVNDGLVRSIGVSNFGTQALGQLLSGCRIQPACNQIERHPMHAQQALVRWCHEKHIRCVAWSPLAKYGAAISRHPLLLAVAERHGVSVPVVMLRWQLQKGVAVIPRSGSAPHIVENMRVWDFALSAEEMELIDGMDEACRVTRDFVGIFEDTPCCPWRAIGIAVAGLLREPPGVSILEPVHIE